MPWIGLLIVKNTTKGSKIARISLMYSVLVFLATNAGSIGYRHRATESTISVANFKHNWLD